MTDQEWILLLARQRQREADPQTGITAQLHAEAAAKDQRAWAGKTRSQYKMLREVKTVPQKIYWLHQMADTFGKFVGPHAACREGCDACCHVPVIISEAEARVIAAATGAPMMVPEQWHPAPVMSFVGQPCPFLVNSRCSIYAERPMPCRTHFNMDNDSLLCQNVPGHSATVPYANAHQYTELYVQIHIQKGMTNPADVPLADLRHFFPKGLGNGEA